MSEEKLNIYNFSELRQRGIDALTEALGPVGMAYFFRQFEPGCGDYTAERQALLADVTLEDFAAYVKRSKEKDAQ
ncbi:MAG: hypothetical protein LBI88_00995 [Deltaproteobacteria bacterium]|nr:hypothetical protein [Deltaproteobacteria bacterium]